MTAEAVIAEMTSSSLPDWVFPPPQGFAAEDLDHLPDLPAHTELIDGSLVFVAPQRDFHSLVLYRLHVELDRFAPADHKVRQEMSVKLGPRQRPEPDLIVLAPGTFTGSEVTYFDAADVVLAVEVISPESALRDTKRKPVLYAEAGIPHFWLVEETQGKATVVVHELSPTTRSYVVTGIHHDRLKLSVPFPIDFDVATLYEP
ncbi:Uma2 family endonuclease [Nonomuraea salmonea]|jgi:Uma2 family endonuclease|uniref:Uma2 family endonuclease n=1 Tax=Nonomuraea salmonea TaxID=46181 RepID=A0ABV5NHW8_9ACTN